MENYVKLNANVKSELLNKIDVFADSKGMNRTSAVNFLLTSAIAANADYSSYDSGFISYLIDRMGVEYYQEYVKYCKKISRLREDYYDELCDN